MSALQLGNYYLCKVDGQWLILPRDLRASTITNHDVKIEYYWP